MRILTLNAGSNSLKFEFIEVADSAGSTVSPWGRSLVAGGFDDIGQEGTKLTLTKNRQLIHSEDTGAGSYEEAARALFEWIDRGRGAAHGLTALGSIDRIAHRVVHGANRFPQVVEITEEVIAGITELEELAPLHNEPARKVIQVARSRMGSRLPMFALFDTAFHRTLPDEAALYPLPVPFAQRHRIRRYGFHGLSHQYLALRTAELLGRPLTELKLITTHLEGGCSIAAIRHGQSIDTSMGFTPLEGLMMGTRSGDLDPAIPLYLMRKEGWDADRTEQFLNKECGLKGVSGVSEDTRVLRERIGEPNVDLALKLFSYRLRKYLGAYLAALGGADAIVFGGGIGENTVQVRQQATAGMEWCGALLDDALNQEVIDREGCISAAGAALPVWVVPTQEGLMMAHHAARA